jgi:outer membrane protein assembly factor BamA
MFLEWSYESARNSLLGLFFEQIDFRRTTLTSTYYIPLTTRWNFSHRLVVETLSGAVPLYAYGEIGGSRRVKGLGGSDSLRGLDTQRFTDDARFFSNAELRFHLYELLFYRQHIEWQAAAFVDAGRVWPGLDELGLAGMHFSGGGELRLVWDADFVIRVGLGAAGEQADIWLSLGQNF